MITLSYVSSNIGEPKYSQFKELLKENNLLSIKSLKFCELLGDTSFHLPENDPRIKLFFEIVKSIGADQPSIRQERIYTKKELANFQYFRLIHRKVGLGNPSENQLFDKTRACKTCGAGSIPIPPITIRRNNFGKTILGLTPYQNFLIVTNEFVSDNSAMGFSGIEFYPANLGKKKDKYYWVKIVPVLPQCDKDSIFDISYPCPDCQRAGHFDSLNPQTQFVYNESDLNLPLCDFNLTYEFFSVWQSCRLGGAQNIIISRRVREYFMSKRVPRLDYEPIIIK